MTTGAAASCAGASHLRGPGSAPASALPGLLLAASAAVLSWGIGRLIPNVSALLVAIVLGAVLGNTTHLPGSVRPGLTVAAKKLLRLGIVVLGLQLSLRDILEFGPGIVAVAVAVVACGFTVTEVVGRRLGLSTPQRLLIGAGMSICGAAAVAAVDGTIEDQDERDTVTAVALVVAFGTLVIAVVPAIVRVAGIDPVTGGLWAGASVHEVAQVVAIGGILGGAALKGAVVVKLARVLLLAPVIAVIGVARRRDEGLGLGHGGAGAARRPPLVPAFVVGFLGAAIVRTAGVLPQEVLDTAGTAQTLLLAAAMFALGTGVTVVSLRSVGGRPVVVAATTSLVVLIVGLAGVLLVV